MPITVFQDLVHEDHGRMMVIDPQGYIIASSVHDFDEFEIVSDYEDYFPSVKDEFPTEIMDKILSQVTNENEHYLKYTDNEDKIQHLVFKELPTFGWIIIYEESEELILSEHVTSIGGTQITIVLITVIISFIGIFLVILVSDRITKPIRRLENSIISVNQGNYDVNLKHSGTNEIESLSQNFKKMIESIKKTIQLEKQLSVEKQKLKSEKLSTIGELASRLAHDMRNPLSLVRMSLENIKLAYGEEEKSQPSFERIDKAIDRMTHQIEGVLDFVRNRSPTQFNCSTIKIIKSAITMLKIPDTIKIEMPSEDKIIYCDEHQTEIIFYNLIQNAFQAIDKKPGDIIIRIIEKEKEILVEFEDSGPGIPKDALSEIFEPLYTTKQTGTGLGLASCKNLIENMGGKLILSNDPTVFTVLFPKKPVD
jgi:signal transduction histidine kinase